jgi:hypothetical protein
MPLRSYLTNHLDGIISITGLLRATIERAKEERDYKSSADITRVNQLRIALASNDEQSEWLEGFKGEIPREGGRRRSWQFVSARGVGGGE